MTVSIDWFVWQNPDQGRTNQNTQIYLKTTLPYIPLTNQVRGLYCKLRTKFFPL